MCTISMIGDHYDDKWKAPDYRDLIQRLPDNVTRFEYDALKKEVEEMKALLKRAKIYDEQNNEKDCEVESKVATLKKIAELMGVDLSEIFK